MNWILTTLYWYVYLFIIGIIFFPLAKRIFPRFFDEGYAFSKTIGIIVLSYVSFLSGVLGIFPFTKLLLLGILGITLIITLYLLRKYNKPFTDFLPRRSIFIFEEILFLSGLLFLAYIRGQEPSIHGLEKFMDFGFMNSILRAQFFPPLDMWYSADPAQPAGYAINYYYFGHLSGAMLMRLTGVSPYIGYNLILATILAQGSVLVFSIVSTLIYHYQKVILGVKKVNTWMVYFVALLGTYIVNLGGNLHTIYLFTKGYPNETPIPFWQILGGYNPDKYWYPNATRFIPFTIHEFPSYSYVVADLHGHVFDIPFVLLTLGLLINFYINAVQNENPDEEVKKEKSKAKKTKMYPQTNRMSYAQILQKVFPVSSRIVISPTVYIPYSIILGFMAAIHYMTNAFDGPIYILLTAAIFFLVFKLSINFFTQVGITVLSFIIFSLPFSVGFSPFVSGIGVNCSPEFLVKFHKIGPFLFEKGNCQSSPLWMLFILWGFFGITLLLLLIVILQQMLKMRKGERVNYLASILSIKNTDLLMIIFYYFGFFLITIPEFFYIKDIYPQHFRANTMFKLGYQAFMIMGIASAYTFYRLQQSSKIGHLILKFIYVFCFFFIFVYPFFSFPSYYGKLDKTPQLDGSEWLKLQYPEDMEIINYLNRNVPGQPVILESQGDSYTDHERISSYTGLPTVAGWLVHEWLWRGSADIVGKRAPDIEQIYETTDPNVALQLLKKYNVQYVVVSSQEKIKYPKLSEDKFNQIGKKIFTSQNQNGSLYRVFY